MAGVNSPSSTEVCSHTLFNSGYTSPFSPVKTNVVHLIVSTCVYGITVK